MKTLHKQAQETLAKLCYFQCHLQIQNPPPRNLCFILMKTPYSSVYQRYDSKKKISFACIHFISIITELDTITASYSLFVLVLINILQLQTAAVCSYIFGKVHIQLQRSTWSSAEIYPVDFTQYYKSSTRQATRWSSVILYLYLKLMNFMCEKADVNYWCANCAAVQGASSDLGTIFFPSQYSVSNPCIYCQVLYWIKP